MEQKDTVTLHVSLAVLVIDDFTGKPVLGNRVKVYIPGQKECVIKNDGYRVFINLQQEEVKLICESAVYERRVERVKLHEIDEVLIIRLMPNRAYPVTNGTTCVSGKCIGRDCVLFWNRENKGYKLFEEYTTLKQNDRITIYNPLKKDLEGKAFLIQNNGKKEFFRMVGKAGNQYRMDRTLSQDYPKVGTLVIPVYEVRTDEWGDFFFPLSESGEKEIILISRVEQTEREWKLVTGKNNFIEL